MHQQAQLRLRKDEVEKLGAEAYVVLAMDLYRTRVFKEENLLLSRGPGKFSKEKSLVYATALSDPGGRASALYGVSRKCLRWGSWVENRPTWFVIDRTGTLTYAAEPTFSTPTSYEEDINLMLEALRRAADPFAAQTVGAVALRQVPSWSREDLAFFLHGTMSTEVVPENVLRAFGKTYPDLFPASDLSNFGLIPDLSFGWPIGLSRRRVPHLGGLMSVGINCASCHVDETVLRAGAEPVRYLGVSSHFDAEAFFGSIIVATFRTSEASNLKRFLSAYLSASDPDSGESGQKLLDEQWRRQEAAIGKVLAEDPVGARDVAAGGLHDITGADLRIDRQSLAEGTDLTRLARSFTHLFHNMRAALHVPDQPPDPAAVPPPSGPGRNDAFGLLSAGLLGHPVPYAPVKFGIAWDLRDRPWVHWDGNTRSPIGRNLLASLGLGAPLVGKRGILEFDKVNRHTELSERIRAPRYPFPIDAAAASRGAIHYRSRCASCHDGPEDDRRLYAISEIGTDAQRARAFDAGQAERFNKFLAELSLPGYQPPQVPGLRSTGKYWSPKLRGVWARSPYLHNGSVRTIQDLLASPRERPARFRRGSRVYDSSELGFADDGPYVMDTTTPGNSNAGHDYGTDLNAAQKRELIEYLKTL